MIDKKILCIGSGGLGSPVLYYLANNGFINIGIIDADKVDITNLHRQIIHNYEDIGRFKVGSAKDKLLKLNPDLNLEIYKDRLTRDNALEIIKNYDGIIDGSDNFATRYLVNDACFFLKKPLFYGSVYKFDGQASVFTYEKTTPCYRCIFPSPPAPGTVPACSEAGILGSIPGVIGSIQAYQCLEYFSDKKNLLINKFLIFDGMELDFRVIKILKNENCLLCSQKPKIKELLDYEISCTVE